MAREVNPGTFVPRLVSVVLAVVLGTSAVPARADRGVGAGPRARGRYSALRQRAVRALTRNKVKRGHHELLAAGRNQFASLWTRDFAYAARGLLKIGEHEVVRRQLDTLLAHVRHDGLLPRNLDSKPVGRRVIVGMLRHRLGLESKPVEMRGKLKAQFLDEHGSISIDSNLTVLQTAMDYVDASHDPHWWQANRKTLSRLYDYYGQHVGSDGLIEQPAYSDWQDSVKRAGKTFYTNLLYWAVGTRLRARGFDIPQVELDRLRASIHETFYDARSGLYRSLQGKKLISIDGNLLALDLGFVSATSSEGHALYQAMKRNPLWHRGGTPGSVTDGNYPLRWVHLPALVTGLRHYHDQLHWSWLTALSAKIARKMGDAAEADRILSRLDDMTRRDNTIGEIYRQKKGTLRPFESWLYRSESPFSWGAGMVIDAIDP